MKITGDVQGADRVAEHFRTMAEAPVYRGEVYMAGSRNANLAVFHAGGTRRGLPPRNPFFVQDGDVERAVSAIRRGERAVAEGDPEGRGPAMGRAAELIATSMQRNIAPPGRLNTLHIGLHESLPKVVGEGSKMQRLKSATRKRKAQVGPRPILVETGEMYQAISSRAVRV